LKGSKDETGDPFRKDSDCGGVLQNKTKNWRVSYCVESKNDIKKAVQTIAARSISSRLVGRSISM